MKVAFIGTHGVGKTTLCYDVAGLLKKRDVNVDIVKEVARLSPLPVNKKTSLEAQTWILTTQIAEEIRATAHSLVVICDRSALDNYAYMAKACGRQKPVERFVDFWMKTYDLLFKVLRCKPNGGDSLFSLQDRWRRIREPMGALGGIRGRGAAGPCRFLAAPLA